MTDLTTHSTSGGSAARLGFWTAILTVAVVALFAVVGIATPARSGPFCHSGTTSSVCLTVQSDPAQAGAAVTATIAGPGVVGPSQISSTLLADGTRHGHFSIDRYGSYAIVTRVTSQGVTRQATQTIDVTAAPGEGTCP